MTRFPIALVVLVSIATYANSQETDWLKTLSVCDVLRDLPKLNGQIVAVRGAFVATDEGWWLEADNCRDGLQTGDFKWPSHLWLTSPQAIASMDPRLKETQRTAWGLGEIGFRQDKRAFAEFFATVKQRSSDQPVRIVATFLGLLETYKDLTLRIRRYPSGVVAGYGFGHLGASPAQVVLKSVSLTDIVVEPIQKSGR
jgi:hypothetical protein